MLEGMNICYGVGRGATNKDTEVIAAWLVGQINRTLQRLLFERDMRKEREALLVALTLLQAH